MPKKGEDEICLLLEKEKEKINESSNLLKKEVFALMSRLEEEYKNLLEEISTRLPDIIINLTKKVFGEVTLEKENVKKIVQEALKEAPEGEELEVFLSEKDFTLLFGEQETQVNEFGSITYKKSMSLSSGDCIVKSQFGLIDALTETKLNQLKREIN